MCTFKQCCLEGILAKESFPKTMMLPAESDFLSENTEAKPSQLSLERRMFDLESEVNQRPGFYSHLG